MKERPDLESKFDERVQVAVKYARTIEDFNELIDPRTLARHCLGPSLHSTSLAPLIGKRKNVSCLSVQDRFPLNFFFPFFFFELLVFFCAEMTSKFNKEMYKKIKEKKNEPLSSIGQKKLRFTNKEREKEKEKEMVERGSSTPILELDGQEA